MTLNRVLAGLALAATTSTAALAADLTPVTFGTNWLAQAEHGGYYQAVADGTYAACGLDVTIQPGGPQVNNRALLLANKIQSWAAIFCRHSTPPKKAFLLWLWRPHSRNTRR